MEAFSGQCNWWCYVSAVLYRGFLWNNRQFWCHNDLVLSINYPPNIKKHATYVNWLFKIAPWCKCECVFGRVICGSVTDWRPVQDTTGRDRLQQPRQMNEWIEKICKSNSFWKILVKPSPTDVCAVYAISKLNIGGTVERSWKATNSRMLLAEITHHCI